MKSRNTRKGSQWKNIQTWYMLRALKLPQGFLKPGGQAEGWLKSTKSGMPRPAGADNIAAGLLPLRCGKRFPDHQHEHNAADNRKQAAQPHESHGGAGTVGNFAGSFAQHFVAA